MRATLIAPCRPVYPDSSVNKVDIIKNREGGRMYQKFFESAFTPFLRRHGIILRQHGRRNPDQADATMGRRCRIADHIKNSPTTDRENKECRSSPCSQIIECEVTCAASFLQASPGTTTAHLRASCDHRTSAQSSELKLRPRLGNAAVNDHRYAVV